MQTLTTDIAIIGAGTAGMGAYRAARAHTEHVVLIEGGPYGTTCARVGCMPSKLLIAAAEAAHAVTHAGRFGVHAGPPRIDGAQVMARVRSERDRFVGFVLDAVHGIPEGHRLVGQARFLDPHRLRVGDHTVVTADRVVMATGSRPAIPPGWREALGERLIVNDDVFDWQDLPGSVAVVGAGVIGLELGQALHRLGVRTRLFGRLGHVGPLTDPALRPLAAQAFARDFPLVGDAQDLSVARQGEHVVLRWQADGQTHEESFDFLLAATGRRPNVDELGLEAAELPLDEGGVPRFDPHTAQVGRSHVFIAGDANAQLPLLHEAADEGRMAGDNAGRFPDVRAHPRRAPLAVVFSDPQIALAGQSFQALEAAGLPFAAGAVSFENQGRSRVMGRNVGALRVYADHAQGRLRGAEMVGPAAEHIGHLLAWSIQRGATVQELLDMPYYHPVIEEGLRTALRDLQRALRMGPAPVPNCIDCGPGA